MFRTVLVANRGEIASRIFRTLRKMGVRSVAVYSEADALSPHVAAADANVCIGPAPASDSYMSVERILDAARLTGADAIHPGYGFLSEHADFAEAAEARGIAFIGPTPEQIRAFGLKHTARALAERSGVPLLPGTGILVNAAEAARAARRIGFPVMLKSTAGGGGIGLRLCADEAELERAFESVRHFGETHFGHSGVYVEQVLRSVRHVEVQVFGDGAGDVVALGERDCSVQRRNQKVLEETPAPRLAAAGRRGLAEFALRLMREVRYRSAGTVEFLVDAETERAYFLEVNTRLQVEHGVTEAVFGIDLVEWMVRARAGELGPLHRLLGEPRGHAIQARIYAEDPAKGFQPSSGMLTDASFPEGVRIDTWVERGTEVSPFYDPLIAKVIAWAETREQAVKKLAAALESTRLAGIETNLAYLRQIVEAPAFRAGSATTALLSEVQYVSRAIDVVTPGTQSTIQDHPGRIGYWAVGVPPSGPMDALALRLGNRILGNDFRAAALEMTMTGPTLRFRSDALVAVTGARMDAALDGKPVPPWEPVGVRAGQTLSFGPIPGGGARTYLCVLGGFDVPEYLGSRSTFTLGGFGGHAGRALRKGDVLHVLPAGDPAGLARPLPPELVPDYPHEWDIGVLEGPHAAPDFFAEEFIEGFYDVRWKVHYNSARTGVRLVGPKPVWARADGGEAGLHPSNIHDTAYAIGSVDFTGDMPIILGPDGPSLGGFVCPVTIVRAELWKVGQLRPGDTVRFRPWSPETAARTASRQESEIRSFESEAPFTPAVRRTSPVVGGTRGTRGTGGTPEATRASDRPQVTYRRAGDNCLLVEFGPMVLDLELRLRVHLMMQRVEALHVEGVIDLTPGIRSLQIHYDDHVLPASKLLAVLEDVEASLEVSDDIRVPSRVVRLPLSWDDPATRLAIEKYVQSVRSDAPWAPSNIEFIRRINGLDSEDDLHRIVFGASYLVLGLGDVYLGAPVATPLDPRHRLVTTKYNPARTWTPENAVGIGGAYLCIYGMEGPGGYQFVGRTLQVYSRFKSTRSFPDGCPWLLRFFDRIQFHPVDAKELLERRLEFAAGRFDVEVDEGVFSLADYRGMLRANDPDIRAFKERQQRAFDDERERWIAQGLLQYSSEESRTEDQEDARAEVPTGAVPAESSVSGSVWKVLVSAGSRIQKGAPLVVVESMKMEVPVESPCDGIVVDVPCAEGRPVAAGQALVFVRPDP